MGKPNLFNSIQLRAPKRNVFDLTHDVKMSMRMGNLTPCLVQECVPGDKFKLSCESLVRFAPLVAPVMQYFDVTMHYFFVPNRILWPNWENWITDPNSTAVPPFVDFTSNMVLPSSLPDYMGIPMGTGTYDTDNLRVSALPFAAYQLIYNEYYRDQNLQTGGLWDLARAGLSDGDNTGAPGLFDLRRRCWEHDYFTASLPFAQKGDGVSVPFRDAEVKVNMDPGTHGFNSVWNATEASGPTPYQIGAENAVSDETTMPPDTLYADMAESSPLINDLRRAFRLQEFLEKLARGGSRYIEYIKSIFGVSSSDARLQRPEYITGIKQPVMISEVLNSTGESGGLPQGNMAGHGISVVGGSKYGSKYCEEHGYIIGVISVMPKTAYYQGVPKHFLKFTDQFDYFTPQFANIGEQAVVNQEIFSDVAPGTGAAEREGVWGYVPRYAEYKFNPSRVAGEFKASLDYWHLARNFAGLPLLDTDFVACNPDTRIFAVTGDEDNLFVQVLNKIQAVRPMPKFGTPSF